MFVVILYCLAYIGANIAANLVEFEGWYTLLAIFAAITGVVCNTRENGMSYRIWVIANSMLWAFYDIFAHAYGPLVQHFIFTTIFTVGLGIDIARKITQKGAKTK